VRRRVRSGQRLSIPVQAITPGLKPDWVIVPALNTGRPEQLLPALERRDVIQAKAQLQKWYANGAQIAASCIGTFILAEAGLLDHKEATTTWWLAPLFRQRYPKVLLDEARMLVPTDVGVTAGAAMGHLDLALWLIRKASPELATLVSRYLLADIRSSQAPYIIPNHLAQADPLVLRFERWARASQGRVLAAGCGQCLGHQPTHPATTLRSGPRQIAAVLLSGSSGRTRAISAPWQRARH
jgi:transcriptional regulator GlxA family with amidase domain